MVLYQFSLVIPTYNEGKNIHNLVRILSGRLDAADMTGNYEWW